MSGCRTNSAANTPMDLPVRYHNAQFGLTFYLAADWKGFSVLTNQWEGFPPVQETNATVERGPILVLRHPLWTTNAPQEDIPIRIFTRRQWEDDYAEKFFTAAGGMDEEISHNDLYVFAFYSRSMFDELPGFEEAGKIVERNQEMNRRELYAW